MRFMTHVLLVGRGLLHARTHYTNNSCFCQSIEHKGIATSTYLSNERGKSCQLMGHQAQSIVPLTLSVTTNIGIEITCIIISTPIEPT